MEGERNGDKTLEENVKKRRREEGGDAAKREEVETRLTFQSDDFVFPNFLLRLGGAVKMP